MATDDGRSRLRDRLGRAARLGVGAARTSASWAVGSLLAAAGRGDGATRTWRSASARAAASLGEMKGLAMKLGQYLSFALPDLPPELRDALAGLQTSAPQRPFGEIAAVIAAALGRPVDEAFREFERTPVAAASIGQVHRARLPDGTAVAVKVQYPDVSAAIRADLANASLLAGSLRLLVPGLDAAAVLGELRDRLLEELDYRLEAEHQAAFAARFAGHPFIAIPAVFASHSAETVLTSAFAEGRNFPEILGEDPALRARVGEILFRFLLGNVLGSGVFAADPHPGNYRFGDPDAPVTFLDFGCVKRLSPALREAVRDLLRAGLEQDQALAHDAVARIGFVAQDAGPAADALVAAIGFAYAPFRRDVVEPFPPVLSGPALRAAAAGTGGFSRVRHQLRIPGDVPFLNRTVVGLYAVLARLGGAACWHRIAREYVCGDPPATALGEAEQRWREARRDADGK